MLATPKIAPPTNPWQKGRETTPRAHRPPAASRGSPPGVYPRQEEVALGHPHNFPMSPSFLHPLSRSGQRATISLPHSSPIIRTRPPPPRKRRPFPRASTKEPYLS